MTVRVLGRPTAARSIAAGDRLCAINGRFLGAPQTGVQRVAREISGAFADLTSRGDRALAGLRFEIWVPGALAEAASAIGLPVRIVAGGSGNLWEQVSLPLQSRAAMLLNLCNMGPLVSRDAVTMIHDGQVFQSPRSYSLAFRTWYRIAQRRLARRHRRILTVSHFSAAELARLGVASRNVLPIHNGCDHVFRTSADTGLLDRLGLMSLGYVVAPASTLAHKNLAVLLDAFRDARLSGLRLVLFGAADADAFARAGLAPPKGVIFAGRIDDAGLRALLENALALAFPSLTEGFGIPPVEAMALGCPAIVTACGALPEVCDDAAVYADAADAADWAGKILALAGDTALRDDHVRKGLERARLFTWERAAVKIANVLRQ